METIEFYRVANCDTKQGLWYDSKGNFTGLIHNRFSFCSNRDLKMPYDLELVGWLSATKTLADLFNWFTINDIKELEGFGYSIARYEASEYKFHNNHWAIKQDSSKLIELIPIGSRLFCLYDDFCFFRRKTKCIKAERDCEFRVKKRVKCKININEILEK